MKMRGGAVVQNDFLTSMKCQLHYFGIDRLCVTYCKSHFFTR